MIMSGVGAPGFCGVSGPVAEATSPSGAVALSGNASVSGVGGESTGVVGSVEAVAELFDGSFAELSLGGRPGSLLVLAAGAVAATGCGTEASPRSHMTATIPLTATRAAPPIAQKMMCEEWVGMGGASSVGAAGVTSGSVDGAAAVAVVAVVGGSKSNDGTVAAPMTIEGVELVFAGAG
jgi:hypothetical protein